MTEENRTVGTIESIEAGLIKTPYVHEHINKGRSPAGGRVMPDASGNYLRRFSADRPERRAAAQQIHPVTGSELTGQRHIPGMEPVTAAPERRARPGTAVKYAERSARLRRIADTAFYDSKAEMENQLTFTDPGLYDISPDTGKAVISRDEITDNNPENNNPDSLRTRISGLIHHLRSAGKAVTTADRPAEVKCDSPDDLPDAIRFFTERKHRIVIKMAVLAGLLAVSVIITVLYAISQRSSGFISTELYAVINLVILALTASFCVFDLRKGFAAVASGMMTYEAGIPFIFASAVTGTAAMFFTPERSGGAGLFPVIVCFAMFIYSVGDSLFNEHAKRSLGNVRNGNLTLLKQARHPGIETGMSSRYAKNGYIAFASKTRFIENIADIIANCIPDSPRLRVINILFAVTAPICGLIAGLYSSSFAAGATVAGAVFAAGMPVFSRLVPVTMLISENAALSKRGGCVLSYSDAQNKNSTGAYALTQNFFIDPKSSIIHDIKPAVPGSEKSCLTLCAVAMRECGSPFASAAAALANKDLSELPGADATEFYDEGCIITFRGHRLFLGNEKLLSDNAVKMPADLDYFDIITGDRRLLFFAIDKKLALVLSVSYHFRQNARKCVGGLVNDGKKIVSAAFDPNIDSATIAGRCRVSSGKISRMGIEESLYIYNSALKSSPKDKSAPVWDGTAAGLSAIVQSCGRLSKAISVSLISGCIINALLCAAIFFLSLFAGTTAAALATPVAIIAGRLLQAAAVKIFS